MKRKIIKIIAFVVVFVFATIPLVAQNEGRPTHHDSYSDYYFSLGYQNLKHPTGPYNTGSFQMEILYSFAGGKAGVTYGKDYVSFSPFGFLWFLPTLLLDGINNVSPQEGALFLIPAIGIMQIHIPLANHVEISAGWDALKITKLKNYKDAYYVTGSVNAGLNIFLGDTVFINAYYEYNHNHSPLIKALEYVVIGIPTQPAQLNGHSFGFRLGVML